MGISGKKIFVEIGKLSVYSPFKSLVPAKTLEQGQVDSLSRASAEKLELIPQRLDLVAQTSAGHANGTQSFGNGMASSIDSVQSAGIKHPGKPDQKFLDQYGPWGLVTGASQGIGAEYARTLAEKGMNVVIVARGQDKLDALAQELQRDYGVKVQAVAADLSHPDGLEAVKQATQNLEVGMLVNNAGTWQFGSFLENDIQKDVKSIALNVEAPMALTHHFAGKMGERGKGGVINVGSGAALHGVPGQAAYSATKGFLQNFSEALHAELKPKGINVLITDPGPVIGEASSVYDQSKVPLQKVNARQVALDSLKQIGGSSTTIPGWMNKLAMGIALRVMPRDMLASIAGYILESATPANHESKPVAKAEPVVAFSSRDSRKSITDPFLREYGPWGVVTGSSRGLGAEYAEQLAKKGMNVVLVARSEDKLNGLASHLKETYGVAVKVVPADLSTSEGRARVSSQTQDLDIGLLINNAGSWQFGSFLENDLNRDQQAVALNSASPLELCHAFGKRMAARGGGGIINVGSGAALHGVPGQATYSATKGFMQNLTEALHKELKPAGVKVMITDPGPIIGEASSAYDQSKVPMQKLQPKDVVLDSLNHLGDSGSARIPGWFNRLSMKVACTLLSRDMLANIAGHILNSASRH
jgi:uncharacterized protein